MANLPYHSDMSDISVEAYLQLDRSSPEQRYEYIDGQLRMLAGGTTRHAKIGINVTSALHDRLRGHSCVVYNSDLRVKLSAHRYVYPDASVSCDVRDHDEQLDNINFPCLIVEILSPGTEAYDRGKKFNYYRECQSVQEYVLVNTESPLVELFRREKNTLWTLHLFSLEDEVKFACLGISLPVTAIYEGITFQNGSRE
ncbi:Uma2 family endonuclease [Ktedonosporobacter rubrisoli]|uniref:Uma2 family endonuclease n=1 Tax=Ktedonosporobacter rubrisoli TaxID=2509675 RepID=A0A4P6JXY6_KTERU|nr:Uma2 family endonuclease [Ktedonosporobacter rubrisoli]QBD80534.1 Uma2 family endonuclease [Ktedonosporobacter rubrisoli]